MAAYISSAISLDLRKVIPRMPEKDFGHDHVRSHTLHGHGRDDGAHVPHDHDDVHAPRDHGRDGDVHAREHVRIPGRLLLPSFPAPEIPDVP